VNRLVVVAIAAVVALASGVGLVLYVGSAEDRAAETTKPVPVLVAARNVADGTSFEDAWTSGAIIEGETPQTFRPETAVVDPSTLEGTLADGGMRAGQVVVDGEFVEPGEQRRPPGPPTFADTLEDGTVAVSFEAEGANAVSELIKPGNRVNLLVEVPDAAELGLPPSEGPAVVHVFQDLEVLAVGSTLIPTEAATADPAEAAPAKAATITGTYTVATAPRDAARVLLLTRQYPVFVTLVGPDTEPEEQQPVGRTDAIPETLTADEAVSGRNP
jgi:Flp pilus assembly protein CpaB